MIGMTLKQYAEHRFFQLVEAKNRLDLKTEEGRQAFILLSVQIHIAKAHVPKNLWGLA